MSVSLKPSFYICIFLLRIYTKKKMEKTVKIFIFFFNFYLLYMPIDIKKLCLYYVGEKATELYRLSINTSAIHLLWCIRCLIVDDVNYVITDVHREFIDFQHVINTKVNLMYCVHLCVLIYASFYIIIFLRILTMGR